MLHTTENQWKACIMRMAIKNYILEFINIQITPGQLKALYILNQKKFRSKYHVRYRQSHLCLVFVFSSVFWCEGRRAWSVPQFQSKEAHVVSSVALITHISLSMSGLSAQRFLGEQGNFSRIPYKRTILIV